MTNALLFQNSLVDLARRDVVISSQSSEKVSLIVSQVKVHFTLKEVRIENMASKQRKTECIVIGQVVFNVCDQVSTR